MSDIAVAINSDIIDFPSNAAVWRLGNKTRKERKEIKEKKIITHEGPKHLVMVCRSLTTLQTSPA